ncbi:hypothetical protein Ppa06_41760 [Planomonospora parontospora subsp. parontospora]|uniref:Uncharacterized protein n=2 Tax=Planomonospora parontospora TaxID=58119 RepID=A0AA37F5Z5_9ACTN|nr:hypothetical protein [Planomonospora parontospora]GGK77978.1 hypothetical protein GCM10010126_41760 [Planomonospora parontospora]GII10378.1 hypothetical protein Ppa06_41760 [Planomonospora parontospora subsp. parontospora]
MTAKPAGRTAAGTGTTVGRAAEARTAAGRAAEAGTAGETAAGVDGGRTGGPE